MPTSTELSNARHHHSDASTHASHNPPNALAQNAEPGPSPDQSGNPDDDDSAGTDGNTATHARTVAAPTVRRPTIADGAHMWRIASDSGELDVNTPYAYALLARDFHDTCRVATVADEAVGFVTGYRRPEAPTTLFVWQIAVEPAFRGRNIGGLLLDALVRDLVDIVAVETTVTQTNDSSRRLFGKFADRHDARMSESPLFAAGHFPDAHEAEPLLTISGLAH
ncbi:diaminobutyrate acetyltransferase [Occultella gossypii]|uniref:L-2,4-diaminobutyric acid acetyltransferase n=1 Tax=Occultella gossypii TaxID=2800820 RepID=A0ABS7SHK9_9MICO|nr:diaminobutyrate acetyltransferase [Occultella gossypii]MBZ2199408.1 diaminobutyrate acetyltransferase [Occultella gossypii]